MGEAGNDHEGYVRLSHDELAPRYDSCPMAGCGRGPFTRGVGIMLITLAVVLVILWALGFLAFGVTSGLIHLLLVVALIVIVMRVVTGRRPVV